MSRPQKCDWGMVLCVLTMLLSGLPGGVRAESSGQQSGAAGALRWQRLPDLPDPLGVAGPFVGVHRDALIVAGGANFPQPVWETEKTWREEIYVLKTLPAQNGGPPEWTRAGKLPRRLGYGAAVSLPAGVLCLGGNDAEKTWQETFLLSWNPETADISVTPFPPLPEPCAHGQAVLVGDVVYLVGGQRGAELKTALNNFWKLDLSRKNQSDLFRWEKLPANPAGPRSFNLLVHQQNGTEDCLYLLGGRRENAQGKIEFLRDLWEYRLESATWQQLADLPSPVMAGTAVPGKAGQLWLTGGDDGALFDKANELKDQHPGFPRSALLYDRKQNRWSLWPDSLPVNQVTTLPVFWQKKVILATGEIRPRVRTPQVWLLEILP